MQVRSCPFVHYSLTSIGFQTLARRRYAVLVVRSKRAAQTRTHVGLVEHVY